MNKKFTLLCTSFTVTALLLTGCTSNATSVSNGEKEVTTSVATQEDVLTYAKSIMPLAENFYQIYYRCSLSTVEYDYDAL